MLELLCFLQHATLAHLEVSAMNATAEKLSKAFAIEKCPPMCQSEKANLVDCYKQNPQKALLCSETVRKFNQCVRSTRMVSVCNSNRKFLKIHGFLGVWLKVVVPRGI